ncbi:MAG: MFS transporter [Deltaproteobacteria bacterium]|nr:MFS transporter [Deltaproteobacteria bacterium]
MFRKFPKAVVFLGLASFFNDVASDAIYPLLPLFLTQTVGASLVFVGLYEGIAESAASLTKVFVGYWSDRVGRRGPFVLAGYFLSNLVRPLTGLVTSPWQALAVRFTDRLGKGTRTAPRDAWLGTLAAQGERGRIFGFHRAMDNAGATLGPLIAMAFLYFFPGKLRMLFLLTMIPGFLSLYYVLRARGENTGEQRSRPASSETLADGAVPKFSDIFRMPAAFRRYLFILFLFTVANSSDAFLILKLRGAGVPMYWIPFLWTALHIVKVASATPGGVFSDRFGRKAAIILGWLIYAAAYTTIGLSSSLTVTVCAFILYGLFAGFTEGPERAMVADLVSDERQRGTAFGLYNLAIGIGALPASVIAGFLWERMGPSAPFLFGAEVAGASVLLLIFLRLERSDLL